MGAFFVGPLVRTARSCPLPLQPLREWIAENWGLDDECLTPLDRMTRMKSFSQHEIDLRWMSGGRRIRIVGTSPTIMLSINDVFQGWFANPKGACDALDHSICLSNIRTARGTHETRSQRDPTA